MAHIVLEFVPREEGDRLFVAKNKLESPYPGLNTIICLLPKETPNHLPRKPMEVVLRQAAPIRGGSLHGGS